MGIKLIKKRTTTTTTSPYNTRADKNEKEKQQEKSKETIEKEKLLDNFSENFKYNFDLTQLQIGYITYKQTGTISITQDTNAMYNLPALMLYCNNCSRYFTHKPFYEIIVNISTIIKNHQTVATYPQYNDMDSFIHNFPQLPDYL